MTGQSSAGCCGMNEKHIANLKIKAWENHGENLKGLSSDHLGEPQQRCCKSSVQCLLTIPNPSEYFLLLVSLQSHFAQEKRDTCWNPSYIKRHKGADLDTRRRRAHGRVEQQEIVIRKKKNIIYEKFFNKIKILILI